MEPKSKDTNNALLVSIHVMELFFDKSCYKQQSIICPTKKLGGIPRKTNYL